MTSVRDEFFAFKCANFGRSIESHVKNSDITYLKGLGLWQIVNGTTARPTTPAAAVAEWDNNDVQAKSHISTSLNQDDIMQVADKDERKEMVDRLIKITSLETCFITPKNNIQNLKCDLF